MHYLYKITNTKNCKVYIGQTNNPNLRWSQHKSNAKYNRGTQIITRAIAKYGAELFTFEIIAICKTQDDVDVLEDEVINQYDSRNREVGYNIDRGGNTVPRTPEIGRKISESLTKFYANNESKRKGAKLPDWWKEKVSIGSMGKAGTNTGKTFDDEWRIKIAKSLSGKDLKSRRKFSDEIEIEICRLYVEEEKSTYALGKQFDCQRTTIADILKRNSIETIQSNYTGHNNGKNIFTKEQEREICEMYAVESRSTIAKKFNCGRTTIRDILIRNGVKL